MNITKFGLIAVGLLVTLLAVGGAYSSSTHVQSTINESVTVDYNESYTVEAADVAVSFYSNETVRNASGGVLQDGTDYDFNTTDANGTLVWYNTSATTNQSSATISYWYDAPSQRSQAIAQVVRLMLLAGMFILLLIAGVSVFDLLGGGV